MTGIIETLPKPEDTQLDYVRHAWISSHGHVRGRVLYDKLKEQITNVQDAVTFSINLAANAIRYQALFNPLHDTWKGYTPLAKQELSLLSTYGVKQLRPMLLSALNRFSKAEIAKLISSAVAWSIRCEMCNIGGGSLEIHYNRCAEAITKGTVKNASEASAAMSPIIPDDARFKANATLAKITSDPLARYLLNILQQEADGEKERQYVPNDAPDITLEHILPENPGLDWNYMNKEEQRDYRYRFGNLALLQVTPNSELGNASYEKKKPVLAQSKFSLTREAAAFKQWGPEAITKRQERLADFAVKAWPR